MPKLDDACQILIEEIRLRVADHPPGWQAEVLVLCLHEIEEDLHRRHPLGLEISRALWLVWEEWHKRFDTGSLPPPGSSTWVREDDPDLAEALILARQLGLSLFPT